MPKDQLLPHVPDLARALAREWDADGVPDVVHAHFWMSGEACVQAAGLVGVTVPTVLTFHALGSVKRRHQGAADPSPPERLGVEAALLQSVDAVVATCADEVSELLALQAPPQRLHVVPCGVDLARFAPDGPTTAPWRGGAARLLSLGRLVRRKGVDTVVDALRLVPGAELVVAGGPAAQDLAADEDVSRLRRLAHQAGVADRVHLLGRVSQAEAARLLRAADLLVSVPWYEPFGIVPLEAMACGTPVVVSAVGGMLDTVVDGVTGRHVAPRDPEGLAEAVTDLLAEPRRLRAAGAAGARRALERYSWEGVAEETETVYVRLAAAPGRRFGPAGTTAGRPAPRLPFGTIAQHLGDLDAALGSLAAQAEEVEEWGRLLARRLDGGRLLVAGNGGSAAEAQHLTAELVGRFEGERRPLSALVLHGDTSTVTALCNDYGGDEVFARQVEAHGRAHDVLLLLSTSGRSRNLLCAAERARAGGLSVWALTGPRPNPLAELADRVVAVDGGSTSSVQEAHLVAVHALTAALERHLAAPAHVPAGTEGDPAPEADDVAVDLRSHLPGTRHLGVVR